MRRFTECPHTLTGLVRKNNRFPEHIRSLDKACRELPSGMSIAFFRSMSVHFLAGLPVLCCQETNSKAPMAGKITEMSTIKQVLLLKKQGYSNRRISRELGDINKETVNNYVRFVTEHSLDIDSLLALDDPELERKFHTGSPAYTDGRMEAFLSELPLYRQQLSEPHMTRLLVWQEYKSRHADGYGKSQFFFHLKQNLVAERSAATAVLTDSYNPAEKLFVDFSGDRLHYVDADTGEIHRVETFVASLPYSDYAFAICVESQSTENFLYALRRCLEYLGGVPRIVVPDNLKAAVVKADRYEPEINRALEDMGNHYHFVTIPCQPRRPTQKALVENQVRLVYRRIYAKLRGRTFFSLHGLNEAVAVLLTEHNRTRMQKRPYSREENFHSNEKAQLQPLPDTEYEMRFYATLTVQQNGHVELRRGGITHFYSVPYTLIGKSAQVIYTRSLVKIYVDGSCVATHPRSYQYGYTKTDGHLASNNRIQTEKSPGYYIARAGRVSEEFKAYVERIFDRERSGNPPEVYYRTCDMLLGLQRRYPPDRFNATCRTCLGAGVFTGKRFEAILKNTLRVPSDEDVATSVPSPTNHGNMRGGNYYQ